jgi:hypothetical protein
MARGLDVPIDTGARSADIDEFLEAGLRNQHADDIALEGIVAADEAAAIRALYAAQLARVAGTATSGPRA